MAENNQKEKAYILEGCKIPNQQGTPSPDTISPSSCDMKGLVDSDKDEPQTSLLYASFNYINSIIGSGVIGIPFAFQQAGFGLGLILLLVVAVMSDFSLVLMVRCGHLAGDFSYQGIMNSAFGQAGFVLLSLLQFIYPFIAMVSYNVVVGDTITKFLVRLLKLDPTSLFSQREVVVLFATAFVTLPLCLYKDIAKLAKVSLFSLACVGFILLAVIIEFFSLYNVVPRTPDAWNFSNWNVIPAIGIMTFAFMCHHNTFLIYGSIRNATEEKWIKVTHYSLTVSYIIAALFGIVGYATFTGNSQGDLLENYCPDDDLINAARIFFSISILLTYPIECFVTREILESTILPKINWNSSFISHQHFIITCLLILITYLLSMVTDCLGIVLELNGVLAAVPLAYILPALCYLKLEPSPILSKIKLCPMILLAFGISVATLGTVFVITDYTTLGTCNHGEIMDYCKTNDTLIT
ncbi:hypothetical protein RUM44_013572 [Polyplax serrata]|uniref:Putative sodium-coupled neutral amino acid transporter 11 n=1 Tax=Polyplax serrata TaxID=468196 RepID=A0ABR1BGF9_POLSC